MQFFVHMELHEKSMTSVFFYEICMIRIFGQPCISWVLAKACNNNTKKRNKESKNFQKTTVSFSITPRDLMSQS